MARHGSGSAGPTARPSARTGPTFINLHELGQIATSTMECYRQGELDAWQWALAETLVPPTEASKRRIAHSLRAAYAVPDEAIAALLRGEDVTLRVKDGTGGRECKGSLVHCASERWCPMSRWTDAVGSLVGASPPSCPGCPTSSRTSSRTSSQKARPSQRPVLERPGRPPSPSSATGTNGH
jgi:hypothetical protein